MSSRNCKGSGRGPRNPAAGPVLGAPGRRGDPSRRLRGAARPDAAMHSRQPQGCLRPQGVPGRGPLAEGPPADPAMNVNVLVQRARRALGDQGPIVTGPGGYSFDGAGQCRVDAEVFLAAVAPGRGPLATRRPSAPRWPVPEAPGV